MKILPTLLSLTITSFAGVVFRSFCAAVWFALLVAVAPPHVHAACDGLPSDAAEQGAAGRFRDTTVAFIGTVLDLREDAARMRVEYVLRGGALAGEIRINDHEVTKIQVGFEPGVRYFIAAVQLPDGHLVTSACKGSRAIRSHDDLENLLAIAGNPPPIDGTGIGIAPLVVILAVLVILGAAWYLAIRRDKSCRAAG